MKVNRPQLAESLVLQSVKDLPSGEHAVTFVQTLFGTPLFGANLVVILSPDGYSATRVASSLFDNVRPASETRAPPDFMTLTSALKASDFEPVGGFRQMYRLTSTAFDERLARLEHHGIARRDDGISYLVAVDDLTGQVTEIGSIEANLSAEVITSNFRPRFFTTIACTSDAQCPSGYNCLRDHCLKRCSSNSDCTTFGAAWTCVSTVSSSFYQYCLDNVLYQRFTANINSVWYSTGAQFFPWYADVKDGLGRINTWIASALGIFSWNNDPNNPADLIVEVDALRPDLWYAHWNGGAVTLNLDTVSQPASDQTRSGTYFTLGHEFGHGVHLNANPSPLPDECQAESHADLHGVLFAGNEVDSTWTILGTGGRNYYQSAYGDEVWGESEAIYSNFIGWLPYAFRSMFDQGACNSSGQLDNFTSQACTLSTKSCPRYQYCAWNSAASGYRCNTGAWYATNKGAWRRFARVWVEGSSTFLENPDAPEDPGITINGVGKTTAAQIYSTVIQSGVLSPYSTMEDFGLQLVAASGAVYSRTRKALGAIGMPATKDTISTAILTDLAAAHAWYPDWTLSTFKDFTVWRDNSTTNLKVRYHNGSSWAETTWTANAGSSPVVETYAGRFHVFWRDLSTGAIKMRYFFPTGGYSTEYNLGTLGLQTPGEFDVEVMGGSLYVVFVGGPDSKIRVSKCTVSGRGCTSSTLDWTSWYGNYWFEYLWKARPGLAAAASPVRLVGSVLLETEALYIAFSDWDTALRGDRIALVGILPSLAAIMQNPIYVDDSAPSNRTVARLALEARYSALDSTRARLHLFWKDRDSSAIYGSILQRWNGTSDYTAPRPTGSPEPYWFTRPRKITLLSSSQGVTLAQKGPDHMLFESVDLISLDASGVVKVAFFGRY